MGLLILVVTTVPMVKPVKFQQVLLPEDSQSLPEALWIWYQEIFLTN